MKDIEIHRKIDVVKDRERKGKREKERVKES